MPCNKDEMRHTTLNRIEWKHASKIFEYMHVSHTHILTHSQSVCILKWTENQRKCQQQYSISISVYILIITYMEHTIIFKNVTFAQNTGKSIP